MHFRAWLIESVFSERREFVPPEVMQQWERGFRQGLEGLIQRTSDPVLRSKFMAMRNCPIRDLSGHCRSFTDYVVGAMLRHGVHRKADIEDALAYAYEVMMSPIKKTGGQKTTVFDLDSSRPSGPKDNPLEARFKTSAGNAARNIASGRIRRLLNTEQRPQGTLSLVPGRSRETMPGTMPADAIVARSDQATKEMLGDLQALLEKQQRINPGLPLMAIFQSMVSGQSDRERRAKFGDRPTKRAGQVIRQTIQDYARSTDNHRLIGLLDRPAGTKIEPPSAPPGRPAFSPDQQDFRSIASVIQRAGRPLSLSELGSTRRRWLAMKPRNPASPYPNRLLDVLSRMVEAGLLAATQTRKGGTIYERGERFGEVV